MELYLLVVITICIIGFFILFAVKRVWGRRMRLAEEDERLVLFTGLCLSIVGLGLLLYYLFSHP